MRIGMFGGTFDPVHTGHLIVAAHVHEVLGLDRTLFVPSAVSPHKQGRDVANPGQRAAMLRLAVAGNPSFDILEDELERGGVSYTVDTLRRFGEREPGSELYVLIGADNAVEFQTWKDPGEIVRLARVAVMTRPGNLVDRERLQSRIPGVVVVQVPGIGIASRDIRARRREGRSIRYLVPEAVESYILEQGIYR